MCCRKIRDIVFILNKWTRGRTASYQMSPNKIINLITAQIQVPSVNFISPGENIHKFYTLLWPRSYDNELFSIMTNVHGSIRNIIVCDVFSDDCGCTRDLLNNPRQIARATITATEPRILCELRDIALNGKPSVHQTSEYWYAET